MKEMVSSTIGVKVCFLPFHCVKLIDKLSLYPRGLGFIDCMG